MKNIFFVALVIGAGAVMAACAGVIDSSGFKVGDPVRFAQATHIARMSDESVQATRTAVDIITTRQVADISAQATRTVIDASRQKAEADKVSAQATVALAKAKTEVEAQPAEARGKSAAYLLGWAGLGAGALVLLVGLAFAITAWANKTATAVYPDARGQFPLITKSGPGWVVFHDANRAIGPGAVIHTPGLIERVAYSVALARGNTPMLEPGTEYPQTAGESSMLQIGVGAQAVQHEIAKQSGRPKLLFGILPVGAQPTAAQEKHVRGRMPQISIVNDPKEIESFEQKLLSDGGDDDD